MLSIFDIFKIGVGPSSSHTLGPWKIMLDWLEERKKNNQFHTIETVTVHLFGSLSLTGKGHCTDQAVILGLMGEDPETVSIHRIHELIQNVEKERVLLLGKERIISFQRDKNIIFCSDFREGHPNSLLIDVKFENGEELIEEYYSLGGGLIEKKSQHYTSSVDYADTSFPYPFEKSTDLIKYYQKSGKTLSELCWKNECVLHKPHEIKKRSLHIWDVMLEAVWEGIHTEGILPGDLQVKRRAPVYYQKQKILQGKKYSSANQWLRNLQRQKITTFSDIMNCVATFAIAVNEVNASLGRVVTAPTNGSAGVIPATLLYYLCFVNTQAGEEEIVRFLLSNSVIAGLFLKKATISAAVGGCQAEIGVSCAMAAAGLTELQGGSLNQCLIAAEIAMEHHLGLTCDPVEGLVQIPCIERNAMGSIKAIMASNIALQCSIDDIRISLDDVISAMWDTAQGMNSRYKETSQGGLAYVLGQHIPQC